METGIRSGTEVVKSSAEAIKAPVRATRGLAERRMSGVIDRLRRRPHQAFEAIARTPVTKTEAAGRNRTGFVDRLPKGVKHYPPEKGCPHGLTPSSCPRCKATDRMRKIEDTVGATVGAVKEEMM